MELSSGLVSFLFGCAGGFSVTAYRLLTASQQAVEDRPPTDKLYIATAIILTVLGGICALANHLSKSVSPITAFNLGLSIPALIKTDADRRARKRPQSKRID